MSGRYNKKSWLNTSYLAASLTFISLLAISGPSSAVTTPDGYNDLTAVKDYQPSSPYIAPNITPVPSTPAMVIRFNQQNVYFQNPLKRVVGKVDSSKPSARYDLESVVPEGEMMNKANNKSFEENLKNVVNVLNRLGVTVDNIGINTITSNTVQDQEIRIYVH